MNRERDKFIFCPLWYEWASGIMAFERRRSEELLLLLLLLSTYLILVGSVGIALGKHDNEI